MVEVEKEKYDYKGEFLSLKEIKIRNYERWKRKGYLDPLLFFEKVMMAEDDQKIELIKNNDLELILQKHLDNRKNHHIPPLIDSSVKGWFPSFLHDISGYISGEGFHNAECQNCLGTDLLRLNLNEKFEILSKYDKKARTKKIRTKLPKDLVGKELKFIKLTKNQYLVKAVRKKRIISFYHKKLDYLKENQFVKPGKNENLDREINEFFSSK